MNDFIDIIDDDEDEEFDDIYYRNARPALRRRPGRSMMRSRPMQATAFVRRPPTKAPVINSKYGSLKWGLLADTAAKTLAAIQPLPGSPTMGDDTNKNLQNLADYHASLAGHAKASQQLHTLGSILKVILP